MKIRCIIGLLAGSPPGRWRALHSCSSGAETIAWGVDAAARQNHSERALPSRFYDQIVWPGRAPSVRQSGVHSCKI